MGASTREFDSGSSQVRLIWILSAVFKEVKAECDYVYQVGNLFEWSESYEFHGVTPGPSSIDLVAKVAIYGDWSGRSDGEQARRALTQATLDDNFHAVLHLGDIAYNLWD